jgi:hypothetical protein
MNAKPRIPVDASPFGINSHLSPRVMEIFAGIGVRWHRIDIDWDRIERTEGQPRWEELDRVCDAAQALGLSLLGSIAYTPSWASGRTPRQAPPVDHALFARFAGQVATRYRGRIAALSVWNEPNLAGFWGGTRAQYLSLLRGGLASIRDAAPDILRCGPDLSSWSEHGGKSWLRSVLDVTDAGPGPSLLDVVTHHQYAAGDTPQGRVKQIDQLHEYVAGRDLHDRPLWVTEIGWDTGKVPNEAQRGAHLRAVMQAMRERREWWQKVFWYDSHGLVDGRGSARWGLLVGPEDAPDFGRPLGAFADYARAVGEAPAPAQAAPGPSGAEVFRVVDAAYRGVLGRPVDDRGLAAHVELARRGALVELCRALFESAELARDLSPEAQAVRLYLGILGRDPDPDGLASTVLALRTGRGPERAADMLRSAEFRA